MKKKLKPFVILSVFSFAVFVNSTLFLSNNHYLGTQLNELIQLASAQTTEIIIPSYLFYDEGCSICTNEYGQQGRRFNCHPTWSGVCQTWEPMCTYGYC